MYQRIKPWNPVGFRAKADFASGPAANHLKRLTRSGHGKMIEEGLTLLFIRVSGQRINAWEHS